MQTITSLIDASPWLTNVLSTQTTLQSHKDLICFETKPIISWERNSDTVFNHLAKCPPWGCKELWLDPVVLLYSNMFSTTERILMYFASVGKRTTEGGRSWPWWRLASTTPLSPPQPLPQTIFWSKAISYQYSFFTITMMMPFMTMWFIYHVYVDGDDNDDSVRSS